MKKSMFDLAKLPERIERKISGLWWVYDDAGMSGSTILLFDKMALKIEKISRSSQNERKLLEWLEGKLPVPKIIEAETRRRAYHNVRGVAYERGRAPDIAQHHFGKNDRYRIDF